jgi:cobalamin biosynthesis protein CobT
MRPGAPFLGFDFESTLRKIARVLTRQYQVEIVFSPSGPRVEHNKLIIPELEHSDPAAQDVLVGYLDLLVARAKHSQLAELAKPGNALEKRLAQIIEDRRVCALLLHDYPGAQWFLGRLRQHAQRDATTRWDALSWSARLLWLIERALWDEPMLPSYASASLQASLSALQQPLQAARHSRSTRASLDAAREIVSRVRMLGAGRVNTMMFSADAAHGFEADRGELADESEPDQGDDDSGPAGEPLAEPPASGAALDSEDGDAVGMSQSMPGVSQLAPQLAPQSAASAQQETAYQRPVLSIPLSTEFDTVTDLTGLGQPAAWQGLRSAARAETGALQTKLERALRADEWTHWKRERERGELDRSALAKLVTAPGYRTPFKVKRVTQGRDTAITLLLDLSGSMAGEKIALARLCAAALADALVQLDFACEVLGYSSIESPQMRQLLDARVAAGVELRRYNRLVERLDLRIYKRFDSTDLSGIASIECGHENPDGECLAWAASRLAEHPAQRRILMVLSDGYPATGDGNPAVLRTDLHARVAAIAKSGIELIGIGILDDAVETFYPDAVVVHKLSELPTIAFTMLSKALLKSGPG